MGDINLRVGSKGPAVRRWQEMLVAIGEKLTVDGIFGRGTESITKDVQNELGLTADGVVGPKTWDACMAKIGGEYESLDEASRPHPHQIHGATFIDCQGFYPWPKNGKYIRDWNQINTIMLHRTACVLGNKPDRWKIVNAHIGVALDGTIILIHDLRLMIWHGHRPSPWSIGVEFDGNPEGYPGKDGKPGYFWEDGGGPHPITPEQERAADALQKYLQELFEKNGQKVRFIIAHRQSDKDRQSDPGWECWQKIALPWQAKFGATDGGNEMKWDSGFTIPRVWDPKRTHPFF